MTAPWTCARCDVTATRMAGHECPGAPANWIEDGDEAFCLGCRRALAGEAGLIGVPLNTSTARRAQIRKMALIDFEVERDPSRSNGEIARAIRTSVVAVHKARERVGATR
jgi:hypothetical protein